jgi:tetratricopeptide (TPR) repeat protein
MIEQSRQALSAAQPERALSVLREAERVDPKNASIQNNLCVAFMGLGKHDEAIAACNAAIGLQPDFQLARNNLAWAQQERAKVQNTNASGKVDTTAKKLETHGAVKTEPTIPAKRLEATSPAKVETTTAAKKPEATSPVKAEATSSPEKLEATPTPAKKLDTTSPPKAETVYPAKKVETFPSTPSDVQ